MTGTESAAGVYVPARTQVVGGIGAVAAVGSDAPGLFAALCRGESGVAPLRGFDRAKYDSHHAYEIDDRSDGCDRTGRATQWLCAAIAEAIADAGLTATDLRDVPVLVGTGLRELRSAELWWTANASFTDSELHFAAAVRERFGCTDVHTFNNACSASLYALGFGADLLDSGTCDTVVVAGVDTLTESMFGLLDRVNPHAVDRVRPFDADRLGVLMGDGAAAVVLRDDGPARARLRSVALNCDAFHETAPDKTSIAAAIRDAHRRAGIGPEAVDVVYAHGTGTALNDEAEAAALAEVFGTLPTGPVLTAIKSMTGHTSGASGLHSLVAAVHSLESGTVPPIVGLQRPIDSLRALRPVTGTAIETRPRIAQIEAFGFGGVNAVALLEHSAAHGNAATAQANTSASEGRIR